MGRYLFRRVGALGDGQAGRGSVRKGHDRLREAGAGDGAGEFDRVVDRDDAAGGERLTVQRIHGQFGVRGGEAARGVAEARQELVGLQVQGGECVDGRP